MSQYLNRKYTLLEFLSEPILINNLINLNKIKTIYRIYNNTIDTWEYNSSFNSFNSLETHKAYFFINKNVEPEPVILHNNTNIEYTNTTVSNPIQMISYKGECPNLRISYFQNKIRQIIKVNNNGLTFDTWVNGSKFNSLNYLNIGQTYLIYSYNNTLPYDLLSNIIYSDISNISLDVKCDSTEVTTYLSATNLEDRSCSSEIISDNLDRCISNIITA